MEILQKLVNVELILGLFDLHHRLTHMFIYSLLTVYNISLFSYPVVGRNNESLLLALLTMIKQMLFCLMILSVLSTITSHITSSLIVSMAS